MISAYKYSDKNAKRLGFFLRPYQKARFFSFHKNKGMDKK